MSSLTWLKPVFKWKIVPYLTADSSFSNFHLYFYWVTFQCKPPRSFMEETLDNADTKTNYLNLRISFLGVFKLQTQFLYWFIGLFRLSISSRLNFGSWQFLKKWLISSRLSNLCIKSCSEYSFIILSIATASVISTSFLILVFWVVSSLSLPILPNY